MDESQKLKDDINQMFAQRGVRPSHREEEVSLSEQQQRACEMLSEHIWGAIKQTITQDRVRAFADQLGITQKIGTIGVERVFEKIEEAIESAEENTDFSDYE